MSTAASPLVSTARKLEALRRPGTFPDRTRAVAVVETHMSWVFLTDTRAYKMKKPVRYEYLDFGTLEARRHDCAEEVRLNRRLAPEVYLGALALSLAADGTLRLGGEGIPVEWLVAMRRLAADAMLDHAIRAGDLRETEVRRAANWLAAFYRRAEPVFVECDGYRLRLERDLEASRRELGAGAFALPREAVQAVHATQLEWLERERRALAARVLERRIVEAHGDLRPEHVCLRPEPAIIDCLEFNREFRVLDPVDELAFFSMECERLGAACVGEIFFDAYRRATGDAPAAALVHFYASHRACLRAKLALWHLREPKVREPERWPRLAREYVRLAEEHARALR